MNMRKLSINKACVLLGTLLLLAVGAVCTAVYLLTQNITAVRCVFLFSLFVLLCVIFFVALIRRKLVRFSDAFCGQEDHRRIRPALLYLTAEIKAIPIRQVYIQHN